MGNHFTSEVKLEHDVYYPGNVVRGTATIHFEKPTSCIAGRIMCRGLERSVVIRNTGEYAHPISQDVVFYKETLTLFGHKTHDADLTPVEVPAGTYTYPFAFELPMHLPGSLHMTNWSWGGAEIKYAVIAYVKIDQDKIDEGHSEFTVIVPVNEKDALESRPVENSATVKLRSFLTDKGTCEAKVSLQRSLFAADDTIEGTVDFDNSNGQADISHFQVAVQCRCTSFVDAKHSGTEEGLHGGAYADPIAKKKLHCTVTKGDIGRASFALRLPHTVTFASYPSRGLRVVLQHEVVVEINSTKIVVPVYIAHCKDDQNRFAFCPHTEPCHRPDRADFEHAYQVPEGYASELCNAVAPPQGLTPQPAVKQQTPQATGVGMLHSA